MTLFATKTCVNCKVAKALLDELGFDYRLVDVETAHGLAEFHLVLDTYNGNVKMPVLVYLKDVAGNDLPRITMVQGQNVINYLEDRCAAQGLRREL